MAAASLTHSGKDRSNGFSLLELVVAMAVLAVLMTIAVPTYRQYVERAARAEAIRQILAAADCQERIRAESGYYDATRCLENSQTEDYGFWIEPAGESSASVFTVLAEPVNAEVDRCGTLGLDHAGNRSISSDQAAVSACWGGR